MEKLSYEALSPEISERIAIDRKNGKSGAFAFNEVNVLRRKDRESDTASVWRTAFIRDIDKILHCPYYNRYADKTQVLSFYKNDDITRRALHVQLVSRIGRTIGAALGLNLDLIEAIALGHDIGHTPFGHAGERYLDELTNECGGIRFSHNIHSVRVLDKIFPYNVSLQTLSGIASHDGELELCEYRPRPLNSFEELDILLDECYRDKGAVKRLVPSTLEGCVMRISDIIAYLGKDRQDAEKAGISVQNRFYRNTIGSYNAEILNNLIVNIIENSYGKDHIKLDSEHFSALVNAKQENYRLIYRTESVEGEFEKTVRPMMRDIFFKLLSDLKNGNRASPIYTHHIDYVSAAHYERDMPYADTDPILLVTDYIASMTDDYFIDLHRYLFPSDTKTVKYRGYFD